MRRKCWPIMSVHQWAKSNGTTFTPWVMIWDAHSPTFRPSFHLRASLTRCWRNAIGSRYASETFLCLRRSGAGNCSLIGPFLITWHPTVLLPMLLATITIGTITADTAKRRKTKKNCSTKRPPPFSTASDTAINDTTPPQLKQSKFITMPITKSSIILTILLIIIITVPSFYWRMIRKCRQRTSSDRVKWMQLWPQSLAEVIIAMARERTKEMAGINSNGIRTIKRPAQRSLHWQLLLLLLPQVEVIKIVTTTTTRKKRRKRTAAGGIIAVIRTASERKVQFHWFSA